MSEQGRATEHELAGLHGEFARFLSGRLQSGEVAAAELNCIRQFLKDNGIDCVPGANPDMNDLVEGLPTFTQTEDEEEDQILH